MKRGVNPGRVLVAVLAIGVFVFVCPCGHVAQADAEPRPAAAPGGFYVKRALSDEEEEVYRWVWQNYDTLNSIRQVYYGVPPGFSVWVEAGRKMPAAERVLCDVIRRRSIWFDSLRFLGALQYVATSQSIPTLVSLHERGEGGYSSYMPYTWKTALSVAARLAVRRDSTVERSDSGLWAKREPRDRRVAACLVQEGLEAESALLHDAIGWPISLGMGRRDEAMPVVGQPWPLHDAVRAGDLERAKVLLEDGVEPHLRDLVGETPLGIAAEQRQLRMVEVLLDGGAEAEAPAAMYAAVGNGYPDAVNLLLSRAPDMLKRDSSPAALLHDAAWGGHLEVMELLLSAGVDVDARAWYQMTPLHWAAWAGQRESVQFLLERGADVNAKSHDWGPRWDTPLWFAIVHRRREVFAPLLRAGGTDGHDYDDVDVRFMQAPPEVQTAAREGRPEAARYLLEHGGSKETVLWWGAHEGYADVVKVVAAAPDALDDDQWREALCVAIDAGRLDIVRLLVAQGADVNLGEKEAYIAWHRRRPSYHRDPEYEWARGDRLATCIEDGTALHWAAARGREDIMEFLLACGADVNAVEDTGTPLHWAVDAGEAGAARLLLARGADPNTARKGGATPLHTAALFNEHEVAEALLEAGANVHAKDFADQRPLHRAATFADAHFVELLLDHGAELNERGFNEEVPLHQAALVGSDNVLRVLLDRGADVTARDVIGRTPLHVATEGGHTGAALLLIAAGADVGAVDKDGETPLHLAARAGDEKVVRAILEGPAPLNVKDSFGLTPLHWAVRKEHCGVGGILLAHGAEHDIHTAAGMGDLAAAEALLAEDPELAGTKLGPLGTPLHWAARGGHPKLVALLLENGAPPDELDGAGESALTLATWRGDRESVALLLSHGADPNAANRRTTTALHIASRLAYADIVELLLSQGADIDRADEYGQTALHFAAEANSLRVARLLLESGADPGRAPDHWPSDWPYKFGERAASLTAALREHSRMAKLVRQYGATE